MRSEETLETAETNDTDEVDIVDTAGEKLTILYRPLGKQDGWKPASGGWSPIEVALLRMHLGTEIIGDPNYPEYLVLRGHYSKAQTLPIMLGRSTSSGISYPYEVWTTCGLLDERLPFFPRFV